MSGVRTVIAAKPSIEPILYSTWALSESHTSAPEMRTSAILATLPLVVLRIVHAFALPKLDSTYGLGGLSRLSDARWSAVSTAHGSMPSSGIALGRGGRSTRV